MLLVLCCVLGVRLFPAHASNHALEILAEVRGRGAVALDENPLTMLSEPGPALDSNLETACRRGCGYPCVLAASLRTATPTARVDAPSGATRNCSLGCSSTGRRLPPRLIIIGAQKGGTTELFATLREHDEFAAPEHKELHFWDECLDMVAESAPPEQEWCDAAAYESLFPRKHGRALAASPSQNRRRLRRAPARFSGEASPSYLLLPQIASLVASGLAPDPRRLIIALLRNPVRATPPPRPTPAPPRPRWNLRPRPRATGRPRLLALLVGCQEALVAVGRGAAWRRHRLLSDAAHPVL